MHITLNKSMDPLAIRLISEMQFRKLRPVVIVEYTRYPFVEKIGNIRITFDENIRTSNDIHNFLDKTIHTRPILAKGNSVLEIKWDEIFPEFIKNHIQIETLRWTNFSKYALCRYYNYYGGIKL